MDEESEPCAKLCGNCANFNVLDDQPRYSSRWFGVCIADLREMRLGDVTDVDATLDWVYSHGRHGQDDCERPDEWFEEG